MEVGALSETITVSGEAPMLEVSKPGSVLTIDAEFQKEAPVVEGKFWSDFLMLTPGVISRPHNDASGRQNYFGNAVEHRDAVTLMEGLYAGNYNDFNINRTGLSSEAIQDTEVKTGGVDAGSPMGYGLVINMASKSGGNQFRGSAVYDYQPFSWNANNVGSGSPATRQVHQYDFAFGGPIRRDKMWFFGAIRYTDNKSGTGRTPELLAIHDAFFPGKPLDNNTITGYQPWVQGDDEAGAQPRPVARLSGRPAPAERGGRGGLRAGRGVVHGRPDAAAPSSRPCGARPSRRPCTPATTPRAATASTATSTTRPGPLIEIHREAFLNQGIAAGIGTSPPRRPVVVDRLRRLLSTSTPRRSPCFAAI